METETAAPLGPLALPAATLQRLRRRILRAQRKTITDSLLPWIRTVSPDVLAATRPGRRHWTDCYRRASDYVLAHTSGQGDSPPIAGLRLVHGICRDSHSLWAHAWVELPGGLVFDGVRQAFYDRLGYFQVLHAVAEATYDAPTMLERMHASGRYGPWHAGVLGRSASRRIATLSLAPL